MPVDSRRFSWSQALLAMSAWTAMAVWPSSATWLGGPPRRRALPVRRVTGWLAGRSRMRGVCGWQRARAMSARRNAPRRPRARCGQAPRGQRAPDTGTVRPAGSAWLLRAQRKPRGLSSRCSRACCVARSSARPRCTWSKHVSVTIEACAVFAALARPSRVSASGRSW
jgi:hypothetical protein